MATLFERPSPQGNSRLTELQEEIEEMLGGNPPSLASVTKACFRSVEISQLFIDNYFQEIKNNMVMKGNLLE